MPLIINLAKLKKKNYYKKVEIKNKIDENYVYMKVDVDETKLPFELRNVYKNITPSFFILSKEGNYIKQYPGSWTKTDFLEILKENIK